jgi:hypothetical protein
MAKYEVEVSKRLMRTFTIEVPDDIPQENVKEWAAENPHDLFDLEEYQPEEEWDVDDLVDGEIVTMLANCIFEDHEYDVEGFGSKE